MLWANQTVLYELIIVKYLELDLTHNINKYMLDIVIATR